LSVVDDHDVMETYSEEVNEMDAAVTSAVFLELIAGIMTTPNLFLIFVIGFPLFSIGLPPYPFLIILANLVYISILIILVVASIYLAWTLWNIIPRARFDTIVMSTISIIVHLPSLSPVIILNLIIIFFLNS